MCNCSSLQHVMNILLLKLHTIFLIKFKWINITYKMMYSFIILVFKFTTSCTVFSYRLFWRQIDLQFSCSCPTLWPHGLQHTRPPCPSPTPRDYSNSCPLSQWCHPTISSSVVPFSFHLQSFPASGSFPMSQLFTSGS